jgi:hypothetical protein
MVAPLADGDTAEPDRLEDGAAGDEDEVESHAAMATHRAAAESVDTILPMSSCLPGAAIVSCGATVFRCRSRSKTGAHRRSLGATDCRHAVVYDPTRFLTIYGRRSELSSRGEELNADAAEV